MGKEQLIDNFNTLNDNSNLADIQQYIADMMKVNKFDNSSLELFCYLTEEIGELAKEIRKKENNMQMDAAKEYNSCLENEIADVFIYILALCNFYNIDLLMAFKNKEKQNLERTWE